MTSFHREFNWKIKELSGFDKIELKEAVMDLNLRQFHLQLP